MDTNANYQINESFNNNNYHDNYLLNHIIDIINENNSFSIARKILILLNSGKYYVQQSPVSKSVYLRKDCQIGKFDFKNGNYRLSDHWNFVRNKRLTCRVNINKLAPIFEEMLCEYRDGFFIPININEKELYYIKQLLLCHKSKQKDKLININPVYKDKSTTNKTLEQSITQFRVNGVIYKYYLLMKQANKIPLTIRKDNTVIDNDTIKILIQYFDLKYKIIYDNNQNNSFYIIDRRSIIKIKNYLVKYL
jgi:hypothetical protein